MAIYKKIILRAFLVALVLLGCGGSASAQSVGVKTNLAYDLTTTANIGAELALAPKWTLDVSGNLNPWTFSDNKKWKHWLVQPEARYWFCNKFMGHFVGAHLLGGQFNFGNWDTSFSFLGTDLSELKDHRIEGWGVGGGLAYGYAWPLSKHWNFEAELGLGYIYMHYDKYRCAKCGEKVDADQSHNFWGVTKAALNLVYVF